MEKPAEYDFVISGAPERGAHLFFNGEDIGELNGENSEPLLSWMVPANTYITSGTLELALPGPCGDQRYPVDLSYPDTPEAEADMRDRMPQINGSFSSEAQYVRAWVDGEVAEGALKLGQSPLRSGLNRLLAPTCEEGRKVTLNGQEIGSLGAPPAQGDADYAIAVQEGCFRLRFVLYGEARANPRQPQSFQGQVFELPQRPDFFMTPATDEVTVRRTQNSDIRTELLRIPCAEPAPPVVNTEQPMQ